MRVDQTPAEVFEAITNVRGWWTENATGNSQSLHDEFEVRFGDVHYSRQKLVEVIPNHKVVWLVTASHLSFVKVPDEWTNTHVCFEIAAQGDHTLLQFTHLGLVPDVECYQACSHAWGDYIQQSLYKLITTGKGEPEPSQTRVSAREM